MKKNVLIVTYGYPPANAPSVQRPYSVAKYLDKEKFNVTVLSCSNIDSPFGFNSDFDETLPNVKLIKIKALVGSNVSSLRKDKMSDRKTLKQQFKKKLFDILSGLVIPDKAIFWFFPIKNYLKKNKHLIENTDIVFTTSPSFSNHLVGRYIKKRNLAVNWIAELRDFHYLERYNKRSFKSIINGMLEKSVVKDSDQLSFISGAMKKIYSEFYHDYKNKMNVIYNGFDKTEFSNTIGVDKLEEDKIIIFYAGSFYRGLRSPVPLLMLLDELVKKGKLKENQFRIRIAGNFENELLNDIKFYNSYKNIDFLGSITREEVQEHLAKSTLLWLIVGNKPTHYTGVPIKFFEYIFSQRPILNFAPSNSEPTRLISKYNLGWNVNVGDNLDMDQGLNQFNEIIEQFENKQIFEDLPLQTFQNFDRENQAKLFEDLFLEVK